MNGNYLIPANSKKSQMIFGMFNGFDLLLFCIGIAASALLMFILPIEQFNMALVSIIPGCIMGLLVFPVPNHHNVLTVIISVIRFFTNRRVFIWKGWCVRDEYK